MTSRMILSVLAIAALIACTRSETQDDKMVVVALSQPPSTLDPRFATDATGTRIAGLLYSSLTRVGPELNPVPEAAESWREIGRKIVFKLRPHLKFSNGREFKPEDIDYSLAVALGPKSVYASAFSLIKSYHSEFKDGHIETTIELSDSSATFLNDLSVIKLIPKQETEKNPSELPVSSGPFTLASQSANEIVLRAWPAHPYAAPKSPGVIFKIVRDDGTRVLKMLKGEVDLAQAEFPPSKIAELEKSDRLKVFKYPGLATTYLIFNLKDPFLAKLNVRQAVAVAIDRPAIIKYKLDGLATLATSVLPTSNPYFDSSLKPIEPSVTKAKELLAKAGTLPTFSLKTSSAAAAAENGRVIANDLVKAGFKINLQSFEWGTFYGDVQAGRFQLATLRWTGTIDPDLYRKAFHSKEIPPLGRNRGGYANADVDRWTEEGLKTVDAAKRKEIYNKVQKKIFEDLPMIPLWYDTEVAVASRRLENYEPPRDGSFWNLTKVEKK